MGVVGGEWNEQTKKLSLSTNEIKTTNMNEKIELNVPAVSKWVEIPTANSGEFIFQKEGQRVVYTQIPFHSQGALLQHRISENTSEHDMNISGFTVVSTAFSFAGYYDLSNLPPVDNSRLGHKHSSALSWVPEGENAAKEYIETNKTIAEYSHKFTLPQSISVPAKSRVQSPEVATFWVMPTGQELGKARTNVFIEATIPGEAKPAVTRLPTYGNNHKALLRSGDLGALTSVIHRPKLAIEYMAEYNVLRNEVPLPWDNVGDQRVNGSSGKFATNHGLQAGSSLRWPEAKSHGIAGYHLPTRPEWEGVIPFGKNGGKELLYFNKTSTEKGLTKLVQVGKDTSPIQVGMEISNRDANTVYAIHFIDDAEGNKMRVAYRYRIAENPDMPNMAGKTVSQVVVRKTGILDVLRDGIDSQNHVAEPDTKIENADFLCVDMVYLGAYFLGSLEDIANEAWWAAQRSADMITRCLPGSGDRYQMYELFTQEEYPRLNWKTNHKSISLRIRPWVLAYWLDAPAKLSATYETPYPGISEEHHTNELFYFSSYATSRTGGRFTQAQSSSGRAGLSVRLFSDR